MYVVVLGNCRAGRTVLRGKSSAIVILIKLTIPNSHTVDVQWFFGIAKTACAPRAMTEHAKGEAFPYPGKSPKENTDPRIIGRCGRDGSNGPLQRPRSAYIAFHYKYTRVLNKYVLYMYILCTYECADILY